MSQTTGSVDPTVVEIGNGVRVDSRGEWERRFKETVLEFCNQVCFPVEALDLPGSEGE